MGLLQMQMIACMLVEDRMKLILFLELQKRGVDQFCWLHVLKWKQTQHNISSKIVYIANPGH